MYKKWKSRLIFVSIFTIIWIIINDGLSLYNISLGIVVSSVCLVMSSRLLNFDYVKTFSFPFILVVKYIFFMFYAVYKSGIITTYRILSGKIAPTILAFDIDERIEDPLLQHIIGNSITLTPGTITIENKFKKLIVLCLHFEKNEEPPNVQFEKHLIHFDKKD